MVGTVTELVKKDNARVVVFTRTPEEAGEIAEALRKRLFRGCG